MNWRVDLLLFVVGVTAFVVVLLAVVALPLTLLMSAACDTHWADFTHRYEIIGGCLVQYDGTWYPEDVMFRVLGS